MPYSAGQVFLEVVPSFAGVQRAAERAAKPAGRAFSKGIDDGLKGADASAEKQGGESAKRYSGAFLKEWQRRIRTSGSELGNLKVIATVDDDNAKAELKKLRKELDRFSKLKIGTEISSAKAIAEARALQGRLHAIAEDDTLDFQIRVNASQARKQLETFSKFVRQSIGPTADDYAAAKFQDQQFNAQRQRNAKETAAIQRAAQRVAAAEARDAQRQAIEDERRGQRAITNAVDSELDRRRRLLAAAVAEQDRAIKQASRSGSDVDTQRAVASTRARYEAEAQLADASARKRATAAYRAALAEGASAEAAARAYADAYDDISDAARRSARERTALARIAANQERAQARSTRKSALSETGQTANAFRVFNGALLTAVTLGPLLIPILAALSAGFATLGVAIVGAALGLGALFAGLVGIGTAVSAMSALDKERRKSKHAPQSTKATDLRGVRDAQLALLRAQEDAGIRIKSALEQQSRAERSLADAQEESLRAQQALTDARQRAIQKLADLRDELIGGQLDERQATFAVQEALVHLNVVLEDNQSTAREKDVAQLSYEQAAHSLALIQKRNVETAKQVDEANAKGVEGSEEVTQAKLDIADAIERVGLAEKDVADASDDVARARVEEARTLADAQQRVVDSQDDLRAAVVATGVEGSSAMDALNEAMGNLSPAGQAFAAFLYSLKPLLDGIRDAAQTGLLPGLQDMLTTLIDTYGPDIIEFVGILATTLGDLFRIAGKVLTDPFWQQFFAMFGKFAPEFIKQFFDIGLSLLTIFAGLAQAFAPLALEVGDFFVDMFRGAADWAKNLAGSDGFQKFLDYVREKGPALAGIFADLGTALVNLAIGLAPYADKLLDALVKFADWLAGLEPDQIALIAGGILALVGAIQALAGLASIIGSLAGLASFVGLFTGGGAAVAGGGAAVGGGAAAVGGGGAVAAGAAAGPVGWIILAVVAIVAALVLLILWFDRAYKAGGIFKQRVDDIFFAITSIFVEFGKIVDTVLGPVNAFFRDILGPTILWFYTDIISPVFNLISGIFGIFWQVVSTVANMIYQIFVYVLFPLFMDFYHKHIEPVWNTYFKPFFDMLANIITNYVAPAWQRGLDFIGNIWSGLIDLVKAPITFVVETIINGGIIDTFNKLVDHFPGMTKVDHVQLPSGWNNPPRRTAGLTPYKDGGILPGYTPGRDPHQFVSQTGLRIALSGGEGILVPELVRELGPEAIIRANRAARHGSGGARYLGGFSDGGIIGWLGKTGRSASDAISSVASSAVDFLRDPSGVLTRLVKSLVGTTKGFPGAAGAMAMRGASDIGGFLLNALSGADTDSGPEAGHLGGMGWKAMEQTLLAAFPGLIFTSAFRPGAITAVGTRSYHGMGRAVDMAPRMDVFNWLSKSFPDSRELFFSPAGPGRQILNGHMGAKLAPVTVADHYDHVHWAYEDGGIVPNIYDNGGYLPPGLSVVMNKTNKPEPVLTSQQFDMLGAGTQGAGGYTFTGDVYGLDPSEIADELERRRKNRLGSASLPTLAGGTFQ